MEVEDTLPHQECVELKGTVISRAAFCKHFAAEKGRPELEQIDHVLDRVFKHTTTCMQSDLAYAIKPIDPG